VAHGADRSPMRIKTTRPRDKSRGKERILALEIRQSKFGFVVFDGPTTLLDWKVWGYAGGSALRRAKLEKRIPPLLDLYAPSIIVVRRRERSSRKMKRIIHSVIRTVKTVVKGRSTQLRILSRREIQSFFIDHGCSTKHQIASLIASWFEELSWKLPRKRKAWEKEACIMPIFDAAATGIVFFQRTR
jgi:hypothetical protein